MKRLSFVLIVGALALIFASTTLTAQEQPTRIVFVSSQAAINAHPAGQAADQLQQTATQEISVIREELQVLVDKANSGQQLLPEEQERFQALRTSLEALQARYTPQIAETAEPAIQAVNEIIGEIAIENGYTIVLDAEIAANGLVVFAQEGLDITPQVIERVRALPAN